tara:strand:+ start:2328 stop:2621 length:294 start_codon:yes stop_codon:yes gene_type:complete
MSEQKLIANIIRQAEIIIKDANRPPVRGTIAQRAEGIRAVAILLQQHEKERNQCEECEGSGVITSDVARPQSFSRDIGVIDEIETTCQECQGSGRKE